MQDLLLGFVLASSNECTLCLAEAVAGSEKAFAQIMNQKAKELGLSQTVFHDGADKTEITIRPQDIPVHSEAVIDRILRTAGKLR